MKKLKLLFSFLLGISFFAVPVHANVDVVEAEEVDGDDEEEGTTAAVIDDGEAAVKPERSNETHLDLGEETDDDDVRVELED